MLAVIFGPNSLGGRRGRDHIGNLVLWLKLAVEAIGALVIDVGMTLAA
jgi:hypothetical protein